MLLLSLGPALSDTGECPALQASPIGLPVGCGFEPSNTVGSSLGWLVDASRCQERQGPVSDANLQLPFLGPPWTSRVLGALPMPGGRGVLWICGW